MKDFRQLKVWGKSHLLALAVYQATASFPREETYGLTSQIRRAASSIPSNVAEGCCCGHRPRYEVQAGWRRKTPSCKASCVDLPKRKTESRRGIAGGRRHRANLQGSQLARTKFLRKAKLVECALYGLSAWDVELDETTIQRDLTIFYTPRTIRDPQG